MFVADYVARYQGIQVFLAPGLAAKRPDLNIVEFRGNVQTRLKKLGDGVAEATFLAMAGLNRLNMTDVPRTAIAPEDMLPAVAQGAIGIERRGDDSRAADQALERR